MVYRVQQNHVKSLQKSKEIEKGISQLLKLKVRFCGQSRAHVIGKIAKLIPVMDLMPLLSQNWVGNANVQILRNTRNSS